MDGRGRFDPRERWNPGERRTVTALFADVRGFAPLASRGTPAQAIAAINAIFVRLGEAIAGESGVVNRVLGSGLLAIFSAPDASDDHAAAAARAALAVRVSLDHGTGAPRGMQAGLGLNTGTVIAGRIGTSAATGYTVVGHAVTVACPLGAAAEPGQILVGPGTAALLSSEFDLRDRGTIDLDGIGPTGAFELKR
jgi:adenylate cyclase